MISWILIAILIIAVLYVVGFYNGLKTLQVQIQASVQEIGNQLKRQSDLIPNLVESVKGYMAHEKGIFDKLTEARKMIVSAIESNNPEEIDKAQTALTKSLQALRVVVESNPQIQASGMVTNLMNELRDTADKVMYARRTLIDLSADFNIRITTIPGVWLASMFGFQSQKGFSTPISGEFLEVSSGEAQTPKVNLQ